MGIHAISKLSLPAILAGALLAASAVLADPMTVVRPAGKLESCGADAPTGCRHLVLRGDPSAGPSQRIYHFPAGFVFVKHWHLANENLVVTQGKLRIAADGQAEAVLNVGDYLHIPAKVAHWGGCPEECEFYLIEDGPTSFHVPGKE